MVVTPIKTNLPGIVAVVRRLMPNIKIPEFASGGGEVGVNVFDVPGHAFCDGMHHVIHFRVGAFHHQFDPSVRKISDIAGDVVLKGDIADGVAEPNPLNPAAEMTAFTMH